MGEWEICYNYRSAKHKERQIQILADLNGVNTLEIIKILVRGGESLPKRTLNRLFAQLDKLEVQIMEKEREYMAIAAALQGEI